MIIERPEAIMINVPAVFFRNEGCPIRKMIHFCRYYEAMGSGHYENAVFCHFISSIPRHQVDHVYICFAGRVVYRAILVEFQAKTRQPIPELEYPYPKNFCITTGPVIKAPFKIIQRGFRGFRYTKNLF